MYIGTACLFIERLGGLLDTFPDARATAKYPSGNISVRRSTLHVFGSIIRGSGTASTRSPSNLLLLNLQSRSIKCREGGCVQN